jgi:hypothetical protein
LPNQLELAKGGFGEVLRARVEGRDKAFIGGSKTSSNPNFG